METFISEVLNDCKTYMVRFIYSLYTAVKKPDFLTFPKVNKLYSFWPILPNSPTYSSPQTITVVWNPLVRVATGIQSLTSL